MLKYINEFIKKVEEENVSKEEILIKINFFQHERFIHLIITLFYAIIALIFLGLISISYIFIISTIPLFIFLICYIIHYFKLENRVQYLYRLYDLSKN